LEVTLVLLVLVIVALTLLLAVDLVAEALKLPQPGYQALQAIMRLWRRRSRSR
jgi:hypothetical protein